jgi:hypothetical protein
MTPRGSGPGGGRGQGSGGGQGRGRMGGQGKGTGGECVCLSCGATKQHERGVPCTSEKCPKCGKPMTRA